MFEKSKLLLCILIIILIYSTRTIYFNTPSEDDGKSTSDENSESYRKPVLSLKERTKSSMDSGKKMSIKNEVDESTS